MSDDLGLFNTTEFDVGNPYDLDYAEVGANNLNLDPNLFAEGIDFNKLSIPDLQSLLSPDVLANFAQSDPESAKLLQGLLGGNLEEDFEVTDKGDVVSTGGTGPNGTPAGSQMPGSKSADTIKTSIGDAKKLADDAKKAISDAKEAVSPLKKLLTGQASGSDLVSGLVSAYMAKKAYDEGEARRKAARGASFKASTPVTATRSSFKGTKYSAAGGLASLAGGGKTSLPPRYLDGHTDGMADKIPAHIDRKRPAALSDGEFVIPADVVSHLGNGNSNAGAKRLYEMMDRIRSARTGNSKQGKQINPDRFLPR